MIFIQINQEAGYEYDIHSLVKAFYPPENISVCTMEKEVSEPPLLWIDVDYLERSIAIAFKQPAHADEKGAWETVRRQEVAVDHGNRKETRNRLKKTLYQLLSDFTGKQLPWGTLTGIRPTKIPMTMLEKGNTEQDIVAYMRRTYDTSMEKIALSIEIAKRELGLLCRLDYQNGYSLYIGIPFCPSTCLYCSFTSFPLHMWQDRICDYLDALDREIEFTADRFKDRYLNSIYIGGGTPTTLTPGQLERLLTKIEQCFDLSHLLEFTVEAGRPDSISREKCDVLRAHGISRISINPQTMIQRTLDLIGRHHTVEQTVECFQMARSLGFDNINMDIIMGLPQETLDDVSYTMGQLRQLKPDNITVHSLAVKRAARLHMFQEEYANLKMVNTQEHLDLAARVCQEMGMTPYYLYRQKNMAGNFENIGYAKTGKAGIYNILIMEEKQTIMALGAGAITKFVAYQNPSEQTAPAAVRIKRTGNVKEVAQYIERIDEMIQRKADLMSSIYGGS